MTLTSGTRLGPYEIVAPLGAGGMGEVYRARDGRLGRDVAVKVLATNLAAEGERLQRFEQEARAAAALNHPNILALYDIGTHEGTPYLVTELLEGETLRETLSAGLVPVRKAIEYAVHIAHGLAAAHERGIVHRDLKPENVFVTDDGRVKILDFGLAKLTQPEPSLAGVTALPTTPPNTMAGVVLGTVGYMSPEQVRGLTADHRSDLFAFGVVLYEMLSGTRAFHGDTAMDAMTAILKDQPTELPIAERKIPPALARIVDRCLEKNPTARFQSTRDLAFALESLSSTSTSSGASEPIVGFAEKPHGSRRTAWTIACASSLVAVASIAAAFTLYLRPAAVEQPSIQFAVMPPDGWTMTGDPHISPDGRRLAFVATDKDTRTMVWVRSLDAVTAQLLKGTENAGSLFWSPDSMFLAFVADGKLKKIAVAGGPPQYIAGAASGGAWGPDGTILFKESISAALSRVSASGGAVTSATTLNAGESRHVHPHFLPDGQHFLYNSFPGAKGAFVGSLGSNGRKQILQDVDVDMHYAQGCVFFTRAGTLMAQRFDTTRLTLSGEPSPVAE
ncbi:MAG TPA: protein kinase, partial [Vicinamibacterales bacterium]|nr:protein kinase [Vicinamibacterales bacterium]